MKHLIETCSGLSALALSALLVSGCSGAPAPGEAGPVAEQSAPLWLNPSGITHPDGYVDVCFNPAGSPSYALAIPAATKTRIQNLVMNNWGRVANINFFFSDTCPTPRQPGTIQVEIDSPFLGPVGVDGASALGTFPTITFRNKNISDRTILHEFGLMLGFELESQNKGTCAHRTSGGTSLEDESDLFYSVMLDYSCPEEVPMDISTWDTIGARRAYGMRRPGSIVGLNGLTVAIAGGSLANGASLVGWPVNYGDWHGSFTRDSASTLLLSAKTGSNRRCLAVQGNAVSSGFTPLVSWDCIDQNNERLEFTGVQWKSMVDACVQASSNVPGATVSIQSCATAGSAADALQRWDFFEKSTRIRLTGSNLCVTIPGSDSTLGTQAKLGVCVAGTSQAFTYDSTAIRFTKDQSRCLAVFGGSWLGLWDGCNGTELNEQFTIKGPVKTMGQCLAMNGSAPYVTVPIGVAPCSTTDKSQSWEYVW